MVSENLKVGIADGGLLFFDFKLLYEAKMRSIKFLGNAR